MKKSEFRNIVKKIIKEEFSNYLTPFFNEDDDKIDQKEWDETDDTNDGFNPDGDYDDDSDSDEPYSVEQDDKETEIRRKDVMNWLDSNQNKHSVLSYKLYPNISKDGARSKFSKKYRGEDKNGHKYVFSPMEINRLYNMKNSFIEKIQESADVFNCLNEDEIMAIIENTIKRYL